MTHPYRSAPLNAFWNKAVSAGFDAKDMMPDAALLRMDDRVMSAGSCFAANIVPYLERSGITYVWTERPHPAFSHIHQESFSYHKFSASYGNVYTVRHLRQLIERALGTFMPVEDRWHLEDGVIDPFRPGLKFPALSDEEFDAMTRLHLEKVLEAVRKSTVFVFTLGLTEGWVSLADGAVFPACPGTIRGTYDAERHAFKNFTVAEITEDLTAAIALIRSINPAMRFILSVSPVPLVATATGDHVLSATIYSKSVLRVAAQEVASSVPDVTYFPAYEIVTGPQAPWDYFEADRREPSRKAIDTVMSAFLGTAIGTQQTSQATPKPEAAAEDASSLSYVIANAECEEAASAI
jgi:hypothetical protein